MNKIFQKVLLVEVLLLIVISQPAISSTSIISLPAIGEELKEENFSGAVVVAHGE